MECSEKLSLEQIRGLLEASGEVQFQARDRRELYEWVNQTLRHQDYGRLKRDGKGLVRRYVAKMTGLSRAQVTRLIGCYQQGGEVQPRAYRRHRFPNRYTGSDVELLAAVDEAHETLSGPAPASAWIRSRADFRSNRHDNQTEGAKIDDAEHQSGLPFAEPNVIGFRGTARFLPALLFRRNDQR
jgi:hypothetical protein